MIVPSKAHELQRDTEHVFTHLELFGIAGGADDRLTSNQILESLLVFDKWCWLTVDDLEDVLARSEHFRLTNGTIEYVGDTPREVFKSDATLLPSKLYTPKVLSPSAPDALSIRLYDRLRVALLIAGSREGSFENITVMFLDTTLALKQNMPLTPRAHGIVLSTPSSQKIMRAVPQAEITALLEPLLYEIKFYETLSLEDPVNQADAARYLFQTKPQEVVEAELIEHLHVGDRYIRMNILTALGVPAYSVGFRPGVSLPPKEERLEPVALSPGTVRSLLRWAASEGDLGVLDYLVCTLKVQNYQGKLREVAPEVRAYIRDILPRFEQEQTIKDCKELLRELPE